MMEIQKSKIQEFADLIQAGIDSWTTAGDLIVEILDASPNALNDICEAHPHLTPEVIVTFERIGRRQVHPKLLLSDAPGIRKLRTLPFSQQEKFIHEPVELLVMAAGKTDTLKVEVKNLTTSQVSQVFTRDGTRDMAAQRAFLFAKQDRETFPHLEEALPFRVVGGTVRFSGNVTLTRSQLLDIIQTMK